MSKYVLCFLILGLIHVVSAQVETTDFEKEFESFKNKQISENDAFKNKINEEFALFLKQTWEEFTIEKPIDKPLEPKPKNPIQYTPPKQDTNTTQPIPPRNQNPEKVPVEIIEPTKENKPEIPLQENEIQILFFNTPIPIEKTGALSVKCNGFTEEAISNYWTTVSKTNYTSLIASLKKNQTTYALNDWATYLLIKKLSENQHVDNSSQVAFQFFCLSQLGYDTKIARTDEQLVLLINFEQMVYELSYLTINNKKYFITTKTNNKGIYSFKNNFEGAISTVNLEIIDAPNLSYSINTRVLDFNDKKINLVYPIEMIDFYEKIPSTDFSVLFNSNINLETEKSIKLALNPLLEGKTEQEAVGILLSFVQHSFNYKTDQDQFGKEKYFFVEDILNFPYSDCEDRSVFFAYLVRELLGLEVIGLSYPNHIATAVHFTNQQIGNTVSFQNKSYTICDPTYIGAPIGDCMPDYLGVSPKVIVVR
jgi:hypothetical protein